MTTSERFDAAINAAFRNRDETTFRALKDLRDQIVRPIRITITTANSTHEHLAQAEGLMHYGDTVNFRDQHGERWTITGVQHLTVQQT